MTAASVLRALFGRTTRRDIDDAAWRQVVGVAPLFEGFDDAGHARLRQLAGEFLAQKSIETAGGLVAAADVPLKLAAQACLPILNLGMDWYRGWHSVLLYPGDFMARQEFVDEDGVAHELERPLSGEAWPDGPVILSLEGVEEGIVGEFADNLVIHEMAHKLDLLNGHANGMPPLHLGMQREAWTRALTDAYEDLRSCIARGVRPPFDAYAGEDPGEFFAVLSEAFFVEPEALRDTYARVYEQFVAFYRQDPAARREVRA